MADIEHKNIADANLHQPKGIGAASSGAVIAADGGGSSATTDNASTPVNLYDNELRRPELKDYAETVNALGNVATTQDIDLESGNVATMTMTDATTFTFSNPPASGSTGTLTLIITQDGTGSRVATWPGSVNWAGGTAPTLSTAAAAIDIISFLTTDGGTTWYGFEGGLNFS